MTTEVPAFGPPPLPLFVLVEDADADPDALPLAEPDADPLAEPDADPDALPLADPDALTLPDADPLAEPEAEPEALELPDPDWVAPAGDAAIEDDVCEPFADALAIGGMMSFGSLSCPFKPPIDTSKRLYLPELPSQ
ncbi:MAG: hypothetical protein KGN78_03505 [Actinomycetales bacterium]|nr:hypothetical protein [Actinomycetales bacterium]